MSVVVPSMTPASLAAPTSTRRWFDVFVRMMWKEMRAVRAFGVVVAVAIAGLCALVAGAPQKGAAQPVTPSYLLAARAISQSAAACRPPALWLPVY